MAVDISVDTIHNKHDLKFAAGLLQGRRMTMIQPNANINGKENYIFIDTMFQTTFSHVKHKQILALQLDLQMHITGDI